MTARLFTSQGLIRWLGLVVLAGAAAMAQDAKTITVFENRVISVPVPKDWNFKESVDGSTGVQTVRMEPKEADVVLQVSFFPDPTGSASSRKGLEAIMQSALARYVAGSVEGEMPITYFDAPDGTGGYATFTDRQLVGKDLKQGEWRMSSTGMRSWPGAYLFFTLLTNSTATPSYKQALDLIEGGIKQIKGPVSF